MELKNESKLFKALLHMVFTVINDTKASYKGFIEPNAFDVITVSNIPETVSKKVIFLVASPDFKKEYVKDEINANPSNDAYQLKLYREVLQSILDKSPYRFKELLLEADLDQESMKDLYYSFNMSYDNQ